VRRTGWTEVCRRFIICARSAGDDLGRNYLHPDLFDMAAAYAFHISENQPFLDGNKRTGLAAALVFLEFNGIEIFDPETTLSSAVLGFSSKQQTKKTFAALLKKLSG